MHVLVTGITCNVGLTCANILSQYEHVHVIGMRRGTDQRPPGLSAQVSLRVGDFGNRASLRNCLVGVDRVFLLCGNSPDQVQQELNFISACEEAKVKYLVKISTFKSFVENPEAPIGAIHHHIEQQLARSTLEYTVLRPSYHFQNIVGQKQSILDQKSLVYCTGSHPLSMVDARDIARFAGTSSCMHWISSYGFISQTWVLSCHLLQLRFLLPPKPFWPRMDFWVDCVTVRCKGDLFNLLFTKLA
jgi:uncharacterized protein YbjT (DUF2867 family)